MKKLSVLFVCLGNICRSPLADAVFQHKINEAGLAEQVTVDSAGTGDWHIGREADPRSQAVGKENGYDLSALRARQVSTVDFEHFDIVLAMDKKNLADLQVMQPSDYQGELKLFLEFATESSLKEVPDPYYGGDDGFTHVLALVEDACDGLLKHVQEKLA